MDLKDPNLNPSKMSKEERREFIHTILTDPSVSMKAMALTGNDGTTIDIDGLVKTIGIEKVEDMLMKVFEQNDCGSVLMNDRDIGELLDKVKRGTATPEEARMATFIATTIAREGGMIPSPSSLATNLLTKMLLDAIWFLKERQNYQMLYADLIVVATTLMIGSTAITPGASMNRYKDSGPDIVLPVIQHVADDIEKILKNAWGDKTPPADLYMLALMTLAEKAALSMSNDQMKWKEPHDIADFFHMDYQVGLPDDDEKGNGSNTATAASQAAKKDNGPAPNTYTPNCYE